MYIKWELHPGQRINGKQLFDYFRKNINDFAPKFDPYDDPYDSNLWLTDNPLGTVMHITMEPLVDGDVIASGYEECCWFFSTLRGPFYWGGYHPVSGNRQFGYKSENGKIVIYTRGADRTTTWYHSGGFEGNWEGETAFKKADNFWRSMQQKLSNFIIQNGGKVGYLYDYHYRPNWNQIKTQLTSNYLLTILTFE
ncbi:MAG: hypothetical protein KGS48_07565 [Bacteroidetes bacterium]|nr:hypothetical protein [Bacteroidota bacterium]